jgi:hypothetical protein
LYFLIENTKLTQKEIILPAPVNFKAPKLSLTKTILLFKTKKKTLFPSTVNCVRLDIQCFVLSLLFFFNLKKLRKEKNYKPHKNSTASL